MRTLYHFPLQPQSRKVRLLLKEKHLDCDLVVERPWERREAFLHLNPACETPVLTEDSGLTLAGDYVITEYLEETYEEPALLGRSRGERAEVRRIIAWFDGKFSREVTQHLLDEKIGKRLYGRGGPDSAALRAGKANIHVHLHYVGWLIDRRNWLAGDEISLADLAAAAHLSCLDYLGDVPWDEHPVAKEWYARLKSRPSFRPLLADHWPGTQPPAHYANLDF
ncbi:MAG: glutathione S-transferase family protein [Rhodospirillaceae bacterium]|jgi:glutathione S-transferase|nr:glutathione S-transferase family protein [Rhodospirillaceae bacterium]